MNFEEYLEKRMTLGDVARIEGKNKGLTDIEIEELIYTMDESGRLLDRDDEPHNWTEKMKKNYDRILEMIDEKIQQRDDDEIEP